MAKDNEIREVDGKKLIRGHCPSCGPDRLAEIKGEARTSFDEDGIWGRTDYRILVCRGCETPYFQTAEVFSEDMDHYQNELGQWESYLPTKFDYWPAPLKRDAPSWRYEIDLKDQSLGELFSDIYRCLNANLPVPAAIATRTTFDRASELLGIGTSKTFAEKLKELQTSGKISSDEKETLAALIDAGSAAAHRGWKPKQVELELLVSIIEAFLHRTFVLGEAAKALKISVPARSKPSRKGKA